MANYIIRRILLAIPTLIAISVIAFIIIQLPPGDYLDQKIAQLEQQFGDSSSVAQADALRHRYGLDRPAPERYIHWVSGFIRGDFGESFRYEREVKDLIWDRMGFTVLLSIGSLIFIYLTAIPLGIYSATHKYHWSDNLLTFLAFLGMSLPGFLIALAIIVIVYKIFGVPLFGLFSRSLAMTATPEQNQPSSTTDLALSSGSRCAGGKEVRDGVLLLPASGCSAPQLQL